MKRLIVISIISAILLLSAAFTVQRNRAFRAPRNSNLLSVKKGQVVPRDVWEWNEQQVKTACVADKDDSRRGAKKGDHVVCEGDSLTDAKPPSIPEGYCIVYYTSGCPDCAVGWVFARGDKCKKCLNCMN
ncbi:MAG TPA: hypothetical protein VEF04_04845 [Blastocatellia bacterium]|nr:hypothetical protein [Blastocatellia bacterium]